VWGGIGRGGPITIGSGLADSLSRTEGLFVGGSSGSAMSGAIRYLRSDASKSIAEDPDANVVVVLPDGVRNYMSKPWFLNNPLSEEGQDLRDKIRSTLGRDLGDVTSVRLEKDFKVEGEDDVGAQKGKSYLNGKTNGHENRKPNGHHT
jgi:hypothetical protein